MNQKKLITVLSIAILALIVVGYTYWNNSNNNKLAEQSLTDIFPNSNTVDNNSAPLKSLNTNTQQSSNSNPAQRDETASWKIYTSSQYGYTIKYPENFSIQTGSSGPGGTIFTLAINSEPVNTEGAGQSKYLWIGVEPKRTLSQCENSEGKITIDGYSVEKCIEQGSFFGQGKGMLASINHGNYSYFFSADYYDKNSATVDKIIATFRFIK
ncbi:TPA: hypothetical protein DCG61_00050 [Patescibacteria group bacterium]|jgi:hypothetical protein|nr:hypothetical protein [Patescibacteria group bacterium]